MYAVGKPEFREKYPTFWQRLVYMYVCGPVGRAKYYVAPTPYWLYNDRPLSEIYDETYPFEE